MSHASQSSPWENESPRMNAAIPERRPATEEVIGVMEAHHPKRKVYDQR